MSGSINLQFFGGGSLGFAIQGEDAGDRAGTSVASAGDVNGDGFEDLIIGANRADAAGNAKNYAGAAYVVFGKGSAFAALELADIAQGQGGFVIQGEDASDLAGGSVASAGDLNGDGFDDLIIGASFADAAGNAKSSAGAAYVVFGKGSAFAPVNLAVVAQGQGGFVIQGEDASDLAGVSVASAGDVNGDGFDDLIVGAPYADATGNAKGNAGAAYVVFGKASGFAASLDLAAVAQGQGGFVIQGEDAYDAAGVSVASAGDLNGDGFDDLVVGADRADAAGNAKSYAGAAYVVFGKASGFGSSLDLGAVAQGQGGFVIQGEDEGDRAGRSVASAGDLNGDGFDDLIIGAVEAGGAGNGEAYAGAAYVIFGKAFRFADSIDLGLVAQGQGGFVIQGEDAGDAAGFSIASAGDVNGDGFDDLIVGASGADAAGNAKDLAGAAYVIFGQAGGFDTAIDLGAIALGQGGFVIFGGDPGDRAGASVAAAGDINGDGFDDLFVGADRADATANAKPDAGAGYVIFGRDFTDQATAIGGIGNDSLAGLDGGGLEFDDRLIGGAGNDTLVAGLGADTLVGGIGADVLRISNLDNLTIRGGRGSDTLALDTAGATLDLRSIPNAFIRGIETIDITGTGNNRLVVTKNEVLNLSDSANTLTVLRNTGDTVSIVGAGWKDTGITGDLQRYVNGEAVLRIQLLGPPSVPTGGNDSIIGTTGADTIDALGGNDTVNGGAGADSIRGNDGDDFLLGGSAVDTLLGGAGNDTLLGEGAADTLTGGDGQDVFRFVNLATDGRDTVTDFDVFTEIIQISAAGFGGGLTAGIALGASGRFVANTTGLATSAAGVGQVTFETDTGFLRYDADGAGGAAGIAFAVLVGVATLSADEIVVIA